MPIHVGPTLPLTSLANEIIIGNCVRMDYRNHTTEHCADTRCARYKLIKGHTAQLDFSKGMLQSNDEGITLT